MRPSTARCMSTSTTTVLSSPRRKSNLQRVKLGRSYSYYTLFPNNGVANKRTLFGSNSQFDDWTSTDIKYTTTRTVTKPTPCVLGADDKLGCYIMCRLIEAGVSGLYVFHVGEEVGGIGSSYLAKTYPDKFHNIDRCIAFDRKGYSDVITHQPVAGAVQMPSPTRCASR